MLEVDELGIVFASRWVTDRRVAVGIDREVDSPGRLIRFGPAHSLNSRV
jgi:hypothetical protein